MSIDPDKLMWLAECVQRAWRDVAECTEHEHDAQQELYRRQTALGHAERALTLARKELADYAAKNGEES